MKGKERAAGRARASEVSIVDILRREAAAIDWNEVQRLAGVDVEPITAGGLFRCLRYMIADLGTPWCVSHPLDPTNAIELLDATHLRHRMEGVAAKLLRLDALAVHVDLLVSPNSDSLRLLWVGKPACKVRVSLDGKSEPEVFIDPPVHVVNTIGIAMRHRCKWMLWGCSVGEEELLRQAGEMGSDGLKEWARKPLSPDLLRDGLPGLLASGSLRGPVLSHEVVEELRNGVEDHRVLCEQAHLDIAALKVACVDTKVRPQGGTEECPQRVKDRVFLRRQLSLPESEVAVCDSNILKLLKEAQKANPEKWAWFKPPQRGAASKMAYIPGELVWEAKNIGLNKGKGVRYRLACHWHREPAICGQIADNNAEKMQK